MPALDTDKVSLGGSAACLSVYAVLTALVVYNSNKCAYCDQRLVVCNYLIALCSFRLAIFALRLAASTMQTWGPVPFWISYELTPAATFCLAQAGAQLLFDWHWHGLTHADIPRPQRLGWTVTRHLLLSLALVLSMLNIVTRNYIPLGYVAAALWWACAAALACGSVWIWLRRRSRVCIGRGVGVTGLGGVGSLGEVAGIGDESDRAQAGIGALLLSHLFALALSAQAVFVLLLALGRFYHPQDAAASLPLREAGVVALNVVPDLLVLLPAVAVDMRDLDNLAAFRFGLRGTSAS
ncbi:hypothetical protein CspeluHIS016_0108450 [Cutaneotrichosporon spelunceum]|uniref:Uncharacterized protein n=1 Tax=Cutaneotrichosporon spelunceum TaxID=1672016 RepID=A0AAD3TPI5_9TREE|nr:hypothetical protein CspeluHIS016_0108450 [Cutaneotrichosporon spelunceum]